MAQTKPAIYIVDDEPLQRDMLQDHLGKMSGYEIVSFSTGEECVAAVKVRKPVILFLDYNLDSQVKNALDGVEILKEIKELSPETEVVMISGQDKIEVAVNSMKYGAFDYIVKGESAFYRAEKAVFNIYRYKKLQGNATRYKNMSLWLAVGVAALIMLVMWLQLTGKISDMPGWS